MLDNLKIRILDAVFCQLLEYYDGVSRASATSYMFCFIFDYEPSQPAILSVVKIRISRN